MKKFLPTFSLTLALLASCEKEWAAGIKPAFKNVIIEWNLITVNATKKAGFNSNLGSRIEAIEAIAIYDAVNSVKHFGAPYHYSKAAAGDASAEAAAVQAAHDVLVNYFPAQKGFLDSALTNSLGQITSGSISAGQAAGSASAADIIALRINDGSEPNIGYPGLPNQA